MEWYLLIICMTEQCLISLSINKVLQEVEHIYTHFLDTRNWTIVRMLIPLEEFIKLTLLLLVLLKKLVHFLKN